MGQLFECRKLVFTPISKNLSGAFNFNMTFELDQGPLEYKPKNTAQLFGGNCSRMF